MVFRLDPPPLPRPARAQGLRLTKTAVDRLPFEARRPDGKPRQRLYMDAELPGFGLLVGTATKTFIAQRDIDGRTRRVTLGRYGVLTVAQAREQARQLIAEMARGIDPTQVKRAKRATQASLREVLEAYLSTRKGLSPKTGREYRRVLERECPDWLERPLPAITPEAVAERHAKISARVAARGRTARADGHCTANEAMVVIRALWNFAKVAHPALPDNPVQRLSSHKAWFPKKRGTQHVKPTELPIWYRAVCQLRNDTQRDYLLLVLFTGLRREEAAALSWQAVDLAARTLRIPTTKNGRSLTLPLSDFLIELLAARQARYPASPWVFPAASRTGHIAEPRSGLDQVAQATDVHTTVHDLRRTFITLAEGCDIAHYALKALVNHSTAGDVTARHYVQISVDRLRAPMQQITDQILRYIGDANRDFIRQSAGERTGSLGA
jgi:integrase